MDKVERKHARKDGQCKQREGNSKSQKETVVIQNTVTEIKRAIDGLKKEYLSLRLYQQKPEKKENTEEQREKRLKKKKKRIFKNCGTTTKDLTYI